MSSLSLKDNYKTTGNPPLSNDHLFFIILFSLLLVACGRPAKSGVQPPENINPPLTLSPPETLITPTTTAPPFFKATTKTNLNVRRGPGTDFEKIGLLVANSTVQVIGKNNDGSWLQIIYPTLSGNIGWGAAEFMAVDHIAQVPVAPDIFSSTLSPVIETISPEQPPSSNISMVITDTPISGTPTPPATQRLVLEINPHTIHRTECARLNYIVEGLTEIILNDEFLPTGLTGRQSQIVCPDTTTLYTLSGLNKNGQTLSQTIRLTVIPATPTRQASQGAIPVSTTRGCQLAQERLNTAHSSLCRFASDGQRLAVPAADGSLWVISTTGASFDQVVDPRGRFIIQGDLVWSPDGQAIAFTSTGMDGLGTGAGYYQFSSGTLVYLGPDARQGAFDMAGHPRWTQDGRLMITWYQDGNETTGTASILKPAIDASESSGVPVIIEAGQEFMMSAGSIGQQIHPWKPGKIWLSGTNPSYEVDY